MDCTICKEGMVTLELDDVEIDFCVSCHGIWLDKGELEILLEDVENKDNLLDSLELDKKTKEKKRRCPICLKKMEKVRGGFESKVLIDRCKKNDGIWCDKGELREILKMGAGEGESKILDLLKDMFAAME